MTPKEQFNEEIWRVLREIKLSALLTEEGLPIVKFRKDSSNKYEGDVLEKLIELEAITLVKDPWKRISELNSMVLKEPAMVYRVKNRAQDKFIAKENEIFIALGFKFDEIYAGFDPNNTTKVTPVLALPSGWELLENKIPQILNEGRVVFEFSTNWSKRFKYFSYMWSNYGYKVSCKDLYECEYTDDYPGKTELWKVNKNIRNTVRKLRKDFESAEVPIQIETENGFTLIIK